MRLRSALAPLALATTLVATTFTASATVNARVPRARVHGGAGGVLKVQRHEARAHVAKKRPKLKYHGGPVMPRSTTRVIYWTPPGHELDATTYTDVIDRYFTDTAVNSGGHANVYSVLTQYTDSRGQRANYDQTFGGSVVDTNPFPANGCPKYRSAAGELIRICLTDKQLRREVKRVMSENGWTPGIEQAFFMVTPDGVGSCFGSNGKACSFTYYCAYHSYFGEKSSPAIYANIPYAPMLANGCGTPQAPNGPVDGTLDSISHEHREMTNDPLLNAWFDRTGYEGSDKCVSNYGKALGHVPSGDAYNQVINGNFYFTQREWSNRDRGCKARRS
jgi:hypothetical protein